VSGGSGAENPDAGQGPVLLDIGGDVGALVVMMPARLDGLEVEIRPVTGHRHHHHYPHVAVVPRPTVAGIVHSLVYPDLTAGRYRLHPLPDGKAALEVEVVGGGVTEAVWPARPGGHE
jgi:hypothetical protein